MSRRVIQTQSVATESQNANAVDATPQVDVVEVLQDDVADVADDTSTKYEVTCKAVKSFRTDDGVVFSFVLDKEIAVIAKNADDEFVETTSTNLNIRASYALASIFNLVPDLADIYQYKHDKHKASIEAYKADGIIPIEDDFSASDLSIYLRKAKMTITRNHYEAGSEYITMDGVVLTHDNAGYNTEFNKINLDTTAQNRIDKMLDRILGF